MSEPTIVSIAIVGTVVAGYIVWFFACARSVLEKWARDNRFEILCSRSRNFRRGPFFWTSSKNQAVFQVKIRDQEGKERTGWICCGGFWIGLFKDETKVKWDDEGS